MTLATSVAYEARHVVVQQQPAPRAVVVDDVAEPEGAVRHGALRAEVAAVYLFFEGRFMSSLPPGPGQAPDFDRRFTRLHIALPGILEGRTEHPSR